MKNKKIVDTPKGKTIYVPSWMNNELKKFPENKSKLVRLAAERFIIKEKLIDKYIDNTPSKNLISVNFDVDIMNKIDDMTLKNNGKDRKYYSRSEEIRIAVREFILEEHIYPDLLEHPEKLADTMFEIKEFLLDFNKIKIDKKTTKLQEKKEENIIKKMKWKILSIEKYHQLNNK